MASVWGNSNMRTVAVHQIGANEYPMSAPSLKHPTLSAERRRETYEEQQESIRELMDEIKEVVSSNV